MQDVDNFLHENSNICLEMSTMNTNERIFQSKNESVSCGSSWCSPSVTWTGT